MSAKRPKPSPDWPMYWHKSGYWAKTVRGAKYYFGRRGSAADGPEFDAVALDDYNANIAYLKAGRGKIRKADGITVRQLAVAFLDARKILHDSGELANRTWNDYKRIARVVVEHFGDAHVSALGPLEFQRFRNELGKGRSVVTLANLVRVTRIIFRWGKAAGYLEAVPDFGEFKEPKRKDLRKDRNRNRREHGLKMFEAEQIRALLDSDEIKPQMRAMVLLGINCAYGNKDCSELLRKQITERDGRHWLEVDRVKTQVERRCPLWPETVAAIEAARDDRPKPADPKNNGRVFLTVTGLPWVRDETSANDEIAKSFSRLLSAVEDPTTGQPMKRPGLSFYALRHTVETIGDRCRDANALNLILGHVDSTMAGVYRERIDDDRLVAVTDYVRSWLFGN